MGEITLQELSQSLRDIIENIGSSQNDKINAENVLESDTRKFVTTEEKIK